MTSYQLFEDPTRTRRAIKQGFSWPACLFNLYWVIAKGLWLQAVVAWVFVFALLASFSTLVQINRFAAGPVAVVAELMFLWFLGSQGNEWLEKKLIRRGFRSLGIVEAESQEAALRADAPVADAV